MNYVPIVTGMGIDTPHPVHMVCRSKNHNYLVMCFSTPFYCTTVAGVEFGQAGDCIIHSPGFEQTHGTPAGEASGFRNDWVHINLELGQQLVDRFHLPCDTLLGTRTPGLLTPYLREIQRERMADDPFGRDAIAHNVEGMMLQIARQYDLSITAHRSWTDQELHNRLMSVRLAMYENLRNQWALPELAAMANLSVSYFSAQFKRFFGISPIEDLLRMRVDLAKTRLTSGSATLAQVAEMCGFSDVYYFSRAFKQRVGVPPGKYRQDRKD